MSVDLFKYNGDIFAGNSEYVFSVGISSERIYLKYLEPAIKELNIYFFQDGGQFKKENLDDVIHEIELLIKWVYSNVEGSDQRYLLDKLKYLKKIILEDLTKKDDIFYIF